MDSSTYSILSQRLNYFHNLDLKLEKNSIRSFEAGKIAALNNKNRIVPWQPSNLLYDKIEWLRGYDSVINNIMCP